MCSGFEQYRGSGRRNAGACNRWRAEKNQQRDYYAGDKMVLNAKRMAAIKKCTDGIKFNSDRYIACMSKEGESP